MISFPMPFASVPCSIWLAKEGERDRFGNKQIVYSETADIETRCCYAPGTQKSNTADDIEDGRPYGARVTMTFYLPKSVSADLRNAHIECYPPDDAALFGKTYEVIGEPYSYMRDNTPGDYSWAVEGAVYLG